MADKISQIYEKAKAKGVLTDGLTEDMFRKQTANEEGLRSFYDVATKRGMKFHEFDEFKTRFYGTAPEATPEQNLTQPTVQQEPKANPQPTTITDVDKMKYQGIANSAAMTQPVIPDAKLEASNSGAPLVETMGRQPEETPQPSVANIGEANKLSQAQSAHKFYTEKTLGELEDRVKELGLEENKKSNDTSFAGRMDMAYSIGNAANPYANMTPSQSNLLAAQDFINSAKEMETAAKEGHGFWKAFGSTAKKVDTWDMGLGELNKNKQLLAAIKKYEEVGEEGLTNDEKALLDASATYTAMSAYYSDKLGRMYKAGQTTAASLPFMIEFMITPLDGAANGAFKGLAKWASKSLTRKVAARAFEAAAFKALVMTALWDAPKIESGTYERMQGVSLNKTDKENGRITFNGTIGGQPVGEAAYNAFIDQYVENLSEMVFTPLEGVGTAIAAKAAARPALKSINNALSAITGSRMGQVFSKIYNAPTVKSLRDKAYFGNFIEEVMEEEVGGVLRLALSTDVNSLKDAGLDLDSQIDTFLGLAPTSIAFGGLGVVENARDKVRIPMYRELILRTAKEDDARIVAKNVIINILYTEGLSEREKGDRIKDLFYAYREKCASDIANGGTTETPEQQAQSKAEDVAEAVGKEVDEQTNQDDGMIYGAMIDGNPEDQAFIVGGSLEDDKKYVIVRRLSDGKVVPMQKSKLQLMSEPLEAETVKAQQQAHAVAVQAVLDNLHVGDEIELNREEYQGETSKITGVGEDGSVTFETTEGQLTISADEAAELIQPAQEEETVWYKDREGVPMELTKEGDKFRFVATGDEVTAENLANMGYTETTNPNEVPEAPADERTPIQVATDDFVTKHAENAPTKLENTIKAVTADKKKAEKKLADARKKLAELPDAYNEATRKAEEKAMQEVQKAQAEVDEFNGYLDHYNGIKAELDARNATPVEEAPVAAPIEEPVAEAPAAPATQEGNLKDFADKPQPAAEEDAPVAETPAETPAEEPQEEKDAQEFVDWQKDPEAIKFKQDNPYPEMSDEVRKVYDAAGYNEDLSVFSVEQLLNAGRHMDAELTYLYNLDSFIQKKTNNISRVTQSHISYATKIRDKIFAELNNNKSEEWDSLRDIQYGYDSIMNTVKHGRVYTREELTKGIAESEQYIKDFESGKIEDAENPKRSADMHRGWIKAYNELLANLGEEAPVAEAPKESKPKPKTDFKEGQKLYLKDGRYVTLNRWESYNGMPYGGVYTIWSADGKVLENGGLYEDELKEKIAKGKWFVNNPADTKNLEEETGIKIGHYYVHQDGKGLMKAVGFDAEGRPIFRNLIGDSFDFGKEEAHTKIYKGYKEAKGKTLENARNAYGVSKNDTSLIEDKYGIKLSDFGVSHGTIASHVYNSIVGDEDEIDRIETNISSNKKYFRELEEKRNSGKGGSYMKSNKEEYELLLKKYPQYADVINKSYNRILELAGMKEATSEKDAATEVANKYGVDVDPDIWPDACVEIAKLKDRGATEDEMFTYAKYHVPQLREDDTKVVENILEGKKAEALKEIIEEGRKYMPQPTIKEAAAEAAKKKEAERVKNNESPVNNGNEPIIREDGTRDYLMEAFNRGELVTDGTRYDSKAIDRVYARVKEIAADLVEKGETKSVGPASIASDTAAHMLSNRKRPKYDASAVEEDAKKIWSAASKDETLKKLVSDAIAEHEGRPYDKADSFGFSIFDHEVYNAKKAKENGTPIRDAYKKYVEEQKDTAPQTEPKNEELEQMKRTLEMMQKHIADTKDEELEKYIDKLHTAESDKLTDEMLEAIVEYADKRWTAIDATNDIIKSIEGYLPEVNRHSMASWIKVKNSAEQELKRRNAAKERTDSGAMSDNEVFDKVLATQSVERIPAKKAKITPVDVTAKDDNRPLICGVYHDNGFVVGTDAFFLFSHKEKYDKGLEGKVTITDKMRDYLNKQSAKSKLGITYTNEVEGRYPNWRGVIPDVSKMHKATVNVQDLRDFLEGCKAMAKADAAVLNENKPYFRTDYKPSEQWENVQVYLRGDNGFVCLRAEKLARFAEAMDVIGADAIYYLNEEKAIVAQTKNGTALLMPINVSQARANGHLTIEAPHEEFGLDDKSGWNVDGIDRRFVYDMRSGSTTPSPNGGKKVKEPTAEQKPEQPKKSIKEAAAEKAKAKAEQKKAEPVEEKAEKLDDFGEKIYGARKDAYKEIAKTFDDVTAKALVEQSLSKAFKKPNVSDLVKNGILTEEQAMYAEALIQNIFMSQKPRVNRTKDSLYKYRHNGETRVEGWAKKTLDKINTLRDFIEADENKRSEILANIPMYLPKEDSNIEGRPNPLNPVYLSYETLKRLDYNSENDVKLTDIAVHIDYDGSYYLNVGGSVYSLMSSKNVDEILDYMEYVNRFVSGDASVEIPEKMFRYKSTKTERKATGKYNVVTVDRKRRITTNTFDTKQEAIDYYKKCKDFKVPGVYDATMSEEVTYEKKDFVPYVIDPKTGEEVQFDKTFNTKEEAEGYVSEHFDEVSSRIAEINADLKGASKEKKSLLDIQHVWESGRYGYEITYKGGKNPWDIITLASGFNSRQEAEKYYKEHKEELEKPILDMLEARKKFTYFNPSKERIGEDYRKGKDATPEMYMNTFGFRGVQFGNWTNARDRQNALNEAFDAFMDLSKATGLSPKALSLNGELGLAFGARGSGSALAHYERDNVVINLTKTKGAGSLAHEWMHALDNYFARQNEMPNGMVSAVRDTPNMRQELREAWDKLMSEVNKSEYAKRSRAKGQYWGSEWEMVARLFEEYVVDKAKDKGEVNSFLASGTDVKSFDRVRSSNYLVYKMSMTNRYANKVDSEELSNAVNNGGEIQIEGFGGRKIPIKFMTKDEFYKSKQALGNFPVATPEERKELYPYVESLFSSMKEREDENTGKTILYSRGDSQGVEKYADGLTEAQQASTEALVMALDEDGVDTIVVYDDSLSGEASRHQIVSDNIDRINVSPTPIKRIWNRIHKDWKKKYEGETTLPKFDLIDSGGFTYLIENMEEGTPFRLYCSVVNDSVSTIIVDNLKNKLNDIYNDTGRVPRPFSSLLEEAQREYKDRRDSSYNTKLEQAENVRVRGVDGEGESGRGTTNPNGEQNNINSSEGRTIHEYRVLKFHTGDGVVYGWSSGGSIYLMPSGLNPNTPVHEYSHLWCEAVRKSNPKLWESVKKQFAPYLDAVRNDEAYQGLDEDGIVEEAVARFSGKRGAERLEQEAQRLIDENPSIKGRARSRAIIAGVKKAIEDLWKWIGTNLFKLKRFKSAEEVADRIMYDLTSRTNLNTGEVGTALSATEKKKLEAEWLEAAKTGNEAAARPIVEVFAREAGNMIHGFHGTGRADRVGNRFRPDRATSGPMAFFTSDREIAENYAFGKEDTSLVYEEAFGSYKEQFRIGQNEETKGRTLSNMWYYLPRDVRESLAEKAGHVRTDWEGDGDIIVDPETNQANGAFQYQIEYNRGNVINALIEQWLESGTLYNDEAKFMKVLELSGVAEAMREAGFGEITYNNPYARHEKVYDVYLKMLNPFDTDTDYNQDFVDGLVKWYNKLPKYQRAAYERQVQEAGSDGWDKRTVTFDDFVARSQEDISGNTTYNWTSIPDFVTDYLKSKGYDGIIDKGGKFSMLDHKVYIPFSGEQVKSADPFTYDKNGNLIPLSERFNDSSDDIRYQIYGENGMGDLDNIYGTDVRMKNLQRAKEMEADGSYDAATIKKNTGWERGADGNWKSEQQDGNVKKDWKNAKTIGELWNDPLLFKAYPELKDKPVVFEDLGKTTGGMYDGDVLHLNSEYLTGGMKAKPANEKEDWSIRGIVAHELQHAIQNLEGWDSGTAAGGLSGLSNRMRIAESLASREAGIKQSAILDVNDVYDILVENGVDKDVIANLRAPKPDDYEVSYKLGSKHYEDSKRYDEWSLSVMKGETPLLTDEQMAAAQEAMGEVLTKLLGQFGKSQKYIQLLNQYMEELKDTDAYEIYRRSVGETEAFNVQERINTPYSERMNTTLESTETYPREMQFMSSGRSKDKEHRIAAAEMAPSWDKELDKATAIGEMTIPERILNNTIAAAKEHADNTEMVTTAVKQIEGRLKNLRKAMRQQQISDKDALDKLTTMAKIFLKNGWVGAEDRAALREVITTIGHATDKSIEDNIRRMMLAVTKSHLGHVAEQFNDLRHTKAQKLNVSGVVEQGTVDIETQYRLDAFNTGIQVSAEKLDDYIQTALDKVNKETDDTKKAELAAEAEGYIIAQKYLHAVGELREEAVELEKALKEAREKSYKGVDHPILAKRQAVAEAKEAIINNRLETAQAYAHINEELFSMTKIGKELAKDFRAKQIANMNKIRHFANSDLNGVSSSQYYTSTGLQNVTNSFVAAGGLFAPLQSLNSMLKVLAPKAPNGQGYLYDHFIRGYVDASEAEYRGLKEFFGELDEKASEILGKKTDWADMAEELNKGNKLEIAILDKDDAKILELTQGQLAYIYAVNKMDDGKMKLRAMGLTSEDMAKIDAALPQKVKDLMDWLQEDFLPRTRNKYNKVYEAMFGAPMAAIDNYFPLRINKSSLNRNEDLANDLEGVGNLSGTTTGAIKERRRNTHPLDLLNADAFDVMVEHLTEMEHWAAFAQLNRDANILFSYTDFKNKLGHMTTMYGSGEQLVKNLKDTFALALGTYKVKKSKASAFEVNLAKGVSTSKITLRVWTAAKQILSHPAFLTEVAEGDGTFVLEYVKNISNPYGWYESYKWALENLPLFEKRVNSRQAGDTRLMNNEEDWKFWHTKVAEWCTMVGMSPNAFIDALTCAQGAKAVYESHKRMYINRGMSEADAEKRAKQDASICYNETQQSSEGAFVSTIQRDKDGYSIFVSLFNNSNMAYMRRLNEHVGELYESILGEGRAEQIDYLTKKYIRMGYDEDKARGYAKTDYNRSFGRNVMGLAVYGYLMQAIWRLGSSIPYLLFGDDDDEKRKLVRKAMTGGAFSAPFRGSVIGKGAEAAMDGYGTYNILANSLPIEEDVRKYENLWKAGKKAELATSIINMIPQILVGIDPATLTNVTIALSDTFDGELDYANDYTTLILSLMSAPEGQIKKLYVDDLGATGDEIVRRVQSNPDALVELGKRYAARNMKRTAPYPFIPRSEEEEQSAIKSAFNNIKKEAESRLE